MSCVLISNRWAPVFSEQKCSRHGSTQVHGLMIGIQRSREPFVFETCLIPLRYVFDTDADDPRHALYFRLSNACFRLPLHPPISLHI